MSDKTETPPSFNEIMKKASASAIRGGTAGACAMGANVACLMWMRTTVSCDVMTWFKNHQNELYSSHARCHCWCSSHHDEVNQCCMRTDHHEGHDAVEILCHFVLTCPVQTFLNLTGELSIQKRSIFSSSSQNSLCRWWYSSFLPWSTPCFVSGTSISLWRYCSKYRNPYSHELPRKY